MAKKRSFSDEFKADAVAQTMLNGNTITSVAKSLKIGISTLAKWVKMHNDQNQKVGGSYSPADTIKMRELERELRNVKLENEFLKKAAAFFAAQHQD